jgi:Flp pilus assembly protein TadG
VRAIESLRTLVQRIRPDARGATIIEFAFVAGPFFALLLAILQTSLIFYADQTLETATQSVSRLVMTGRVQSNTNTAMNKAAFKTAACSKLPSS